MHQLGKSYIVYTYSVRIDQVTISTHHECLKHRTYGRCLKFTNTSYLLKDLDKKH